MYTVRNRLSSIFIIFVIYDLYVVYKEDNKDLSILGYIYIRLFFNGFELELNKRRSKLLVLE
jgi:hypothetical protein